MYLYSTSYAQCSWQFLSVLHREMSESPKAKMQSRQLGGRENTEVARPEGTQEGWWQWHVRTERMRGALCP